MFGMFSSCAIPSGRKMKKKIDKINRVRKKYSSYCKAIISDADDFTNEVLKAHNEMRKSIDAAMRASDDFEIVRREYNNMNSTDDEIEEDDESDDDEFDKSDIEIAFADEEIDDDLAKLDDDLNDLYNNPEKFKKKNIEEDEEDMTEDDVEADEESSDMDNAESDTDDTAANPVMNDNTMKPLNLDGAVGKFILASSNVMTNSSLYKDIEEYVKKLFTNYRIIDENTTVCNNDTIMIHHTKEVDGETDFIASIEIDTRLFYIPSKDAHLSVLKAIGLESKRLFNKTNTESLQCKSYEVKSNKHDLGITILIDPKNKRLNLTYFNGTVVNNKLEEVI